MRLLHGLDRVDADAPVAGDTERPRRGDREVFPAAIFRRNTGVVAGSFVVEPEVLRSVGIIRLVGDEAGAFRVRLNLHLRRDDELFGRIDVNRAAQVLNPGRVRCGDGEREPPHGRVVGIGKHARDRQHLQLDSRVDGSAEDTGGEFDRDSFHIDGFVVREANPRPVPVLEEHRTVVAIVGRDVHGAAAVAAGRQGDSDVAATGSSASRAARGRAGRVGGGTGRRVHAAGTPASGAGGIATPAGCDQGGQKRGHDEIRTRFHCCCPANSHISAIDIARWCLLPNELLNTY